MKKIKILDIPFDVGTKQEALERIMHVLLHRGEESGKHIVTPNPEMLLESERNSEFRKVLQNAWMSIPDGIGILWAATFQKMARKNSRAWKYAKALSTLLGLLVTPSLLRRRVIPERISGIDLMDMIAAESQKNSIPIFLLGAKAGVAEKVKINLEKKYPNIRIVGTYAGSPHDDDRVAILAQIAELQPRILFVAYGSPAQELWIAKYLPALRSVKIAMGVGGAFDFLAGVRKRAPKIMQKLGLEWLYRLIQEPKRFKRIWNAVVKFPNRIIR